MAHFFKNGWKLLISFLMAYTCTLTWNPGLHFYINQKWNFWNTLLCMSWWKGWMFLHSASRSIQISRKLIIFRLASSVTSRPKLVKKAWIFFSKMSTCLGEEFVTANPMSYSWCWVFLAWIKCTGQLTRRPWRYLSYCIK